MNVMKVKQSNTKWTSEQKKKILQYCASNPRISVCNLCVLIEQDLGYSIKRRTLQHYINNKDKIFNYDDKKTRGRYVDLEHALHLWITYARNENLILTNEILIEKAKRLSQKLGNIPNDFKYSNGWLERFKKRFDVKKRIIHGETANVNLALYDIEIKNLQNEMSKYNPSDVYNMDEAALFYEMLPSQTLSITAKVSGTKQSKKRITVVLCTNMNGTDKFTLSIIGHSGKPRCFKNFNHKAYVDYFHNKKAWMTTAIFNEWLQCFDLHVGKNQKKVLLLLDNCSTHVSIYEPKSVKIMFLPPGTTSKLQPLDAGIIRTFKAYYKRNICLHEFENYDKQVKSKMTLKDVLKWSKESWEKISEDTIINCWKHVGFYNEDTNKIYEETMYNDGEEIRSLQEIIEKLDIKSKLTAHDYLQTEEDCPPTHLLELSEDDIINLIKDNNEYFDVVNNKDNLMEISLSDDDLEITEVENETVLRATDCKDLLKQIETFFNDKEQSSKKDIDAIYYLQKRIDEVKRRKQATLDNFLKKIE